MRNPHPGSFGNRSFGGFPADSRHLHANAPLLFLAQDFLRLESQRDNRCPPVSGCINILRMSKQAMINPSLESLASPSTLPTTRYSPSPVVPTKNSEPGRQFSVMSDDSICGGAL
ncbi:hypothetical protein HBI70_078780 [Parastagonospora nodorum]|nr:hypothetical protein HBH69_120180 [Parastagonospora nodorum]KAH5279734.1 hypothetical protein HBI70_078780 [Parastagonospora nodorum]KAH5304094.1 hypothetical protein HBI11_126330 [Parastagonospora nodorum]KAH5316858.1 hypothetical protein HBI12_122110 [Parastagonospora nodorum]KAH5317557.1 hypothetical protein HBI50_128640 [Parastagonospora nodorum]